MTRLAVDAAGIAVGDTQRALAVDESIDAVICVCCNEAAAYGAAPAS